MRRWAIMRPSNPQSPKLLWPNALMIPYLQQQELTHRWCSRKRVVQAGLGCSHFRKIRQGAPAGRPDSALHPIRSDHRTCHGAHGRCCTLATRINKLKVIEIICIGYCRIEQIEYKYGNCHLDTIGQAVVIYYNISLAYARPKRTQACNTHFVGKKRARAKNSALLWASSMASLRACWVAAARAASERSNCTHRTAHVTQSICIPDCYGSCLIQVVTEAWESCLCRVSIVL